MAVHAEPALVESRVDSLADRLGAPVLETVWAAEFSLLLRYWECSHRSRTLAGKLARVLLAGLRAAALSDDLYRRSRRRSARRPPPGRRNGTYVRPKCSPTCAFAQSVSRAHATTLAMDDPALGI